MLHTFEYDARDRRTTVKVGDQLLSRNVYNDTAGDRYGTLERMEYGNGHVVRNSYDEFKRVVGVQYDDDETDRYSYEYGANGQVARVTNHELNRTVLSEHDSCSRPMRVTHMEGDAHVYTGEVTYDVHNNLASFEEQVGTARTPYTTTFSYDEENRPTLLKYGSDTDKVAYTYDGLGRIEKRTLTVGGTARETSYAYIAGGHGDGSTTGLIATIEQTGGNFTYTYDDNGNITSVVQDGVTTSYTYDALGQLIRVVDGHEGATWEYSYDQGGNILSKKKYVDDTLVESKTFTYGNSNWKDQLTAVNGAAITYDQIGNPLNDGTWTYTWEKGRQLKSMSKSGTTASFKYNENGLRIQKTVNGVVTNYTLHGKNIVHMTQGNNVLHFFYDASNKPAIVEFNGTKYAYVHNLQGDIVAILDSNGTAVVQYKYDAWGKPISKTGSMASTLGTVQPFRYRGYVYDEETGLYYLRSRYYSADCCRFVNVDSVGNRNLFSYCLNSPINQVDSDGTSSNYATMIEMAALHEFVVSAVADRTGGVTKREMTGIPGAGRGGGWGYPDVVKGSFAWEVKPLSPYGLESGRKQITRYTNNTGYIPGYPLLLGPYPYELAGKKGTVHIWNGTSAFGDKGVVYYKFIPDPEDTQEQTSPVHVTVPENEKAEERSNSTNFSLVPSEEFVTAATTTLAVVGITAIVLLTPIDEILAFTSLFAFAF